MRAGVQAAPQPLTSQQRGGVPGSRGLAVGPRDLDRRKAQLGMAQLDQHSLDGFKRRVDAEAQRRLDPLDGLPKRKESFGVETEGRGPRLTSPLDRARAISIPV